MYRVADLHRQYGPVVRISPNDLSFVSPQAWKDIYGHRAHGEEEFPKDRQFYRMIKQMPESLFSMHSREEHGQVRRQLAHGFSDRSMRGQEPIIGAYVDLLISRLHENAAGGANALNMREWLNWTTFDIIGDLGFGSSFDCLESRNYHPWVKAITQTIKASAILQGLTLIGLQQVVQWIVNSGVQGSRTQHRALLTEKLQKRIDLGAERPDLIEGLIRKKDGFVIASALLWRNAHMTNDTIRRCPLSSSG
jgi:cytochrome P450